MSKLITTISNICRNYDSKSVEFGRHSDRLFLSALVKHLSDDEIERLQNEGMEYYPLQYFIDTRNKEFEPKAERRLLMVNKPIHEVLATFADKKSKGRQEARQMLRSRFPEQDADVQMEILRQFLLAGTKIDVVWVACTMCKGYWLAFQMLKIEQNAEDVENLLIEKAGEFADDANVARFALDYLSDDFAQTNASKIENAVGYLRLARKLAKNADWQIDRKKLSDIEYVFVAGRCRRNITDKEAWNAFVTYLADINYDGYNWQNEEWREHAKVSASNAIQLSLADLTPVRRLLQVLGECGLTETILRIYALDSDLQDELQKISVDTDLTVFERDAQCKKQLVDLARKKLSII